MARSVDITPSPRILRTLGEIPFSAWQSIAELIDNSLDAFTRIESSKHQSDKRIVVSWSGDHVAASDRNLEVIDTGPGMELDSLQNCVRAGYSSNDPINNLGLFGMGFNIATARIGETTLILSATSSAKEWVGIKIDFEEMTKKSTFSAPVVTMPKTVPTEHGTKIVLTNLKPGMANDLRSNAGQIRRMLEEIYTPYLQNHQVEIMVQAKKLAPRPHCTWDQNRYVSRRGEKYPAIIRIDQVIGEALFNISRNRYLTSSEEAEARNQQIKTKKWPPDVVMRQKKIFGWLGIQRYADPDDYGIDFIRNGRKLLIGDKTLFYFQNQFTGRAELEYPVELGGTVGGRIVGEIHVNHIPPTYQKTDFDRSDPSWYELVEYLRGGGPILPQKRKSLGYEATNDSPLAILINSYRRADAGTRDLAAPNKQARLWGKKFYDGESDFLTDEKWWKAAQEADREKADSGAGSAPSTNVGEAGSDDVDQYGPEVTIEHSAPAQSQDQSSGRAAQRNPDEIIIENLKPRATRIETHSGEYLYEGCRAPFIVNAWEIHTGGIGKGPLSQPAAFFTESNQCDFFYDPKHPFLADYPTTPVELLLVYLAERFRIRDNQNDIGKLYVSLMRENLSDTRIDRATIQETARNFFNKLRETSINLLSVRELEALQCIHESHGEVEDTMAGLMSNPQLLKRFQSIGLGGLGALMAVPPRTLIRLVDRFPEEFFDGKFFKTPFTSIEVAIPNATERLRAEAKDRLLSYLKDALWVLNETQLTSSPQRMKDELNRCGHSLRFLQQETVV